MYVRDYRDCPPVVVSVIGFRQHGKTIYLDSLFYAFKQLLPQHWPGFYTIPLNEECLETVNKGIKGLDRGELPDASPKVFPRPTIVQMRGVPFQPNSTLLCYDTSGEAFEKPTQLVQYASFVKRARTVMFLIAVPKLADAAGEMDKLLNTYLIGMAELDARTPDQHLMVVYTQADEMIPHLTHWPDVQDYLKQGSIDKLAHLPAYIPQMRNVSDRLRDFTRTQLNAHEFLSKADANKANANFKSVSFTIVSALGAKSNGDRLSQQITPRCVLDPLLLGMEKSLPGWKQTWRR